MWKRLPPLLFVLCLSSGTVLSGKPNNVPRVTLVTPKEGSCNGGTRITLRGQNFAKTLFTLGNDADDIGNKVTLVSLEAYNCDIHPDGTHEAQITCYTTPMPEGIYEIKVSVDGVDVPDENICPACTFHTRRSKTPTITSVEPRSGLPGEVIRLSGNLCTDKYGSNIPNATDAKIIRVYFGGQKCELRKSIDDMYGLEYSNETREGHLMCKTEGTFIGNHAISYMVSNDYGRSAEDGFTKYPWSNGIGMYQTFSEITRISLNHGSTAGGTKITISGKYFDETTTDAKVEIAGAECTIAEKVTDTAIVCTTPPDSSGKRNIFTGGRGLHAYVKAGIVDAGTIDKNTARVEHLDSSEWKGHNMNDHTVLITGFFVPMTTNEYSFCVRAASEAKLFISTDGDPTKAKLIGTGSSTCEGPYALSKGQRCYIEVHYSSDQVDSYVSLVGSMKETRYSESDTKWADHETQKFTISGRSNTEVQEIEVQRQAHKISTPDIQEIVVEGDGASTFVIGLDGVYTDVFSLPSLQGDVLQKELQKLPSVVGKVTVKVKGTETSKTVTISSKFEHGKVGKYKGLLLTGAPDSLTFTNSRPTMGSSDSGYFALSMDGKWTKPIKIGSTAKQVKYALDILYSVQCHPKLKEGIVQGFESKLSWMSSIVSDIEPFCGRHSIKNPSHVVRNPKTKLSLSTLGNRYICFAYKGPGGLLKFIVNYENVDDEGESKWYSRQIHVTNPNPVDNMVDWNYWCEDIYVNLRRQTPGILQVVDRIKVVKRKPWLDLYMDQFAFRKDMPISTDLFGKISIWRTPQAQPKGFLIDRVGVTQSESSYQIEMKPHSCGHSFELFGILSGTVKRIRKASKPITGTYRISFKDDTTEPITVTKMLDPEGVAAFLATTQMGYSEVEGTGTCSSFTYKIKMVSLTGDQPDIRVDVSQLKGDTVTAKVQVVRNGQLWLCPIMGDVLRTRHDTPQVMAYINGIPTRCAVGAVCDFVWSEESTAVVSSVTPQKGSRGDSVTISGSGFGDSQVIFGNTPCSVTLFSSKRIVCNVNNGPTGPAKVKVYVKDKGLASGDVIFRFITGVNSFPTLTGSLEGGTTLTFSGFGFTTDAVVKVDGNICTILNISESDIECIIPRAESFTTTVVDVIISQEGSELRVGQFTYSPSATPTIASSNVSTSFLSGGGVIAITGSGFGSEEMPVMLEDVKMEVISYTDDKILAVLPAMPQGSYKIIVNVDGKGYADLRKNSIPDIRYIFVVTSMYPQIGSIFGGTDLTIEGEGFEESLLQVHVGHHECKLTSFRDSSIQCRIQATGAHHHIFANGTHKRYGLGYAWDKDPYTIRIGDTVTWHWETPFYIKDIAYSVRQTKTVSDVEDMAGGISSGSNTRKGSFSHTFTKTGPFYYWTNYMDSSLTIYFRGMLHIIPLESSIQDLSVKMLGTEASYQTSTPERRPSFSCPETTSIVSGCDDKVVLKTKPNKFNFKFRKCISPIITGQSLTSGTFNEEISLQGKGFGPKICQNVISYGEQEYEKGCTQVSKSSTSSLKFKIVPTCKPPVGELLNFKLHVHNMGYALASLPLSSSRFGLIPTVKRILPSIGSKVGGTRLTILGAGFIGDLENVNVKSQKLSCEIQYVAYTIIVCTTKCPSAPNDCHTGQMSFFVTVNTIVASCQPSVCLFSTSEAYTPEITRVTPNSVSSAPVKLKFSGSKLTSKPIVFVGGVACIVSGARTKTNFSCDVGRLPVGNNDVSVYISPHGNAATTEVVASEKTAAISSPSESSVHGGATLVLSGNGFVDGDTDVKVNGEDCTEIVITASSQVTCKLPPQNEGTHSVVITSNGQIYDKLSVKYSLQSTPVVKGIRPGSGGENDQLEIVGLGFKGPDELSPRVKIGEAECKVTTFEDSSITCSAGAQSAGRFPVEVFVEEIGLSNRDVTFSYTLKPFTVSPSEGSPNGGQTVTISGSGYLANETSVTICGEACEEMSVNSTEFVCKTAPHTAGSCDVVATVKGVSRTETSAYKYKAILVSTVTRVQPGRGGTGGGTVITVTGTNFGKTKADISVLIEGSECEVQSVTHTQITCKTGPSKKSVMTEVDVQRNGWGLAEQKNAAFEYIDVWSSVYTWGGQHAPVEGDFIVIPKGQKILLDVDTPVLAMLLVQGGHLVFDEKDIELQSQSILITDGGVLEIGSEQRPFRHKAIVTLHGHVRSKELPVYGAMGIGLREGMLELHGQHISVPWTHLSATATAGTSTITLTHRVDWSVGDEVVIATTGNRLSQKESEVGKIQAVSSNGMQLTLEEPLKYEHISETATFGSKVVHFKAEVGLLTRNVVIRGHRNVDFDQKVKACPDDFNPGEFSTQTCFQGRFGEEVGSDQYGVHILIHQQVKDTQVAQAHIENVEVTHAGQAFRLGRYPIHFHLNGNMSQSYVRRCAIHHTFNRAVNIHGSHHSVVEYNVVYNAMGGALFLEDGDETGNTFQYNLEVLIKSSTSLLNDDVTPAGIWVTNPYNIIRHNTAAGGTHFGIWYRMHKHPDGPGFTTQICPQNVPLGEYSNNTGHSLGWFGLWIFEEYVPKDSHICSSSADHKAAKFYGLTAWNNNKGAEVVNAGAIQFHDFVLVNNREAGIQFSLITGKPPQYDADNGPGVFNSLIVAHHEPLKGIATIHGISQPHFNGFLMEGVTFYNFNRDRSAALGWTVIAGKCTLQCGGFTTAVRELTFSDSPNKVKFAWKNEGVIRDLDGSLTGTDGQSVVACSGSFNPSKCQKTKSFSVGVDGCICSRDIKFIRFAFNNIEPKSLLYKNAIFTNSHGATIGPWREKRISYSNGWQVILSANEAYDFTFEDAEQVVNISYDGKMFGLSGGDYVILSQRADQMPDDFRLNGSSKLPMSSSRPTPGDHVKHEDWFYSDHKVTYAIKNDVGEEKEIRMRATRCYFRGCQKPASPIAIVKEPENAERTSVPSTWKNLTSHGKPPDAMDDLHIASDRWIIVDTVLPKLGKVVVDGGLQFAEDFLPDNLLEADHIYIKGRLVVGWSEEKPFNGKLTIRLRGNHSTPEYPVSDGPNLGSKFIAVFGGLQLHGTKRKITKTVLSSNANKGDRIIKVKDSVDWNAGEDILISTTDYDAWHTEIFKIKTISDKSLTLNGTIKHRHLSHQELVNGRMLELSASVALLSRNIRVEGANYKNLSTESFGARIIVGQTFSNDEMFSGFAQVSNVEFYHFGQEGFTSSRDPRYALTYQGVTSKKGNVRYSYVKHNAFHDGFSPAIGVFGMDGLEVEGNIIHHTVGPSIQVETDGAKLTNNLVTLSVWPGSYLGREESQNDDFSGGIHAYKAANLTLVNNTVAGSERSAFGVPGQSCKTEAETLWSNNMAIGAQSGVTLFDYNKPADKSCTQLSGFILWRNFDYGIYYNNKPSVVIKNNVFIENSVGVALFILGPQATTHEYADKSAVIEDNVFIGKTSRFSETLDVIPSTDNVNMSLQARPGKPNSVCGKIAILTATFTSGKNKAPIDPWLSIMAYQAIKGITIVKGNHFINYGACTGGRDHVIATNQYNDDVIHPLTVANSKLTNVDQKAKILFHVPNVRLVNPSDCVDMDCDGHKKCLVIDLDGTFLGSRGSVLPDAAYEWDGDERHGLGNYRIPTTMLVMHGGVKRDPNKMAPIKGLYKIDECSWKKEWTAYDCRNGLKWRMLVVESMDNDTETRRISPVAVYHKDGYLDLVNGPQDHGWCSGYTCQKRLSTFPTLVALGQTFELFLTGTNPRRIRYMLLNSKPSECVRLGMWYNVINRLEVKVDGRYVLPNNGYYDMKNRYRVKLEVTKGQYMPDLSKKSVGENYVSQEEQIVSWVVCGGVEVIVNRVDALMVSFTLPEMTVDEFFGEGLVQNLAGFLNIDPKKVRIVSVVMTTNRRGPRSSGTSTIYMEVSDPPGDAPSTNIAEVGDKIIRLVQLGSVSDVLKVEVLYASIVEPDSTDAAPTILRRPGKLVLHTPPVGNVVEDVPLSVQPRLKVMDIEGHVVGYLGSLTSPWEVEAFVKSGELTRATVVGTSRIQFVRGWANYTDLAISDLGVGYVIGFRVVSPPEAANYTIDSPEIQIFPRPLLPQAILWKTMFLTETNISLQAGLVDRDSNKYITKIGWDGYAWSAHIEIYDPIVYSGTLTGITKAVLDPLTGIAKFSYFRLDKPGTCPLLVTILSSPKGYVLKMVVFVDLITLAQGRLTITESHEVQFKFPINFYRERVRFWALQVANVYSVFPGSMITKVEHELGSLYIMLAIVANDAGYTHVIKVMCEDVAVGRNFSFDGTLTTMSPFLKVDGKPYYDVHCGHYNRGSEEGGWIIWIVVFIIMFFLVAGGLLILVMAKWRPQSKINCNVSASISNDTVEFDENSCEAESTATVTGTASTGEDTAASAISTAV